MAFSYDVFHKAFLAKITEYTFLYIEEPTRTDIIDGYMKAALAQFKKAKCEYDLYDRFEMTREFAVDIPDDDLEEIADIISEGMVVQWLKPYVYKEENLSNVLFTADYKTYSPAELLKQCSAVHTQAKKNFTNMIRQYTYDHGDIASLHM